ncbi:hypothetical protein CANCADRAFT_18618, partial [Tortispora caseinolytica NRRL Y-17796]
PFVFSAYLQLIFNLILSSLFVYLIATFVLTIKSDVDAKVDEYSAKILEEIAQCTNKYLVNRCAPGTRVEALEAQCEYWEKCMKRDPAVVGRARVGAETFAEIINSFIEPITYKTMFFFLIMVFGSLFVSNAAFGFWR